MSRGSVESGAYLAVLGKTSQLLLGEDELAAAQDVERSTGPRPAIATTLLSQMRYVKRQRRERRVPRRPRENVPALAWRRRARRRAGRRAVDRAASCHSNNAIIADALCQEAASRAARTSPSSGKRPSSCLEKTSSPPRRTSSGRPGRVLP